MKPVYQILLAMVFLTACSSYNSKAYQKQIQSLSTNPADYADYRLTPDEIEEYVSQYQKTYIMVNGKKHPVFSDYQGDYQKLLEAADDGIESFIEQIRTIFYFKEENGLLSYIWLEGASGNSASIQYGVSNGIDWEYTHEIEESAVDYYEDDDQALIISLYATLLPVNKDDEKIQVEIVIDVTGIFGTGTAQLEIADNQVIVSQGTLGISTHVILRSYLQSYPGLDTLVLQTVYGSVDDDINLETGRLVRWHGMATKVLQNSDIASGAVDLFASGTERIYTRGAKIRVHSWCCSDNGEEARYLPPDDEAHYKQLGYVSEMMGEKGRDFYFFTLRVAGLDSTHTMSESEILKYELATQIID